MPARSLLHDVLRVTWNPGVRALWLKSVEGLSNVPSEGGVLLASNHESYLDFIVLDVALPRPPVFLAGEVFYQNPLFAWAFDRMNFIRVDRDRTGNAANVIGAAKSVLEDGGVVAMYPEGTRSLDGKLRKAHAGVGLLAHLSEVPVVPVAVRGTWEAWSKGTKRPKKAACSVHFGSPLRFSKDAYDADPSIVRDSTRQIMKAIAELAHEEYPW